ncbi:MAG: hypothetical protein RLZZ324_1324 [Candidatus Parcubacteria bacterium]|jgi:large subunit ribosomal protein L19
MAEDIKNAAEEAVPEVKEEAVEVVAVKAEEIVPGMVVRVHQKIKETGPKGEDRERLQVFEGTVIAVKGQDETSRTIHVRKIASGVGVERIFPVNSPVVAKIEVVKKYAVRRAKLYFTRDNRKGLKEKQAPKKEKKSSKK